MRAARARRGADVRQGRMGPGRRRAAAPDDLRPAGLSGRRQHGGWHRRALRRARHRRRASDRSRCAGFSDSSRPALRRTIGPAYFIVGVFYVALACAPTLPLAALCVLCAHFGGAVLWVFSTVLLQMEVPDRFRGRVFAAELALVTLTSSISSYSPPTRSIRLAGRRDDVVRARRDVLRARRDLADHRVAVESVAAPCPEAAINAPEEEVLEDRIR